MRNYQSLSWVFRRLGDDLGVPKPVTNGLIQLVELSDRFGGSDLQWYASPPSQPYLLPEPPSKKRRYTGTDQNFKYGNGPTETETEEPRRRSNRVNMVMGYRSKPFRKKRVKGMSRFLKQGHVIVREHGAEVSAGETLYVGHGIAGTGVLQVVSGAIARLLCRKMGIAVINPVDNLFQNVSGGNVGDVLIRYRPDSASAMTSTSSTVLTNGATFQTLRGIIDGYLQTIFSTVNRQPELFSINFQPYTDTAGFVNKDVQVDLTTCMIEFEWWSKIIIQNRSVASSGVAAANELATDVENNPIVGKVYQGFGNTLEPRFAPSANLATNSFSADESTGLISFDSQQAGVPAPLAAILKHPPSKGFFKSVYKMGNTRLNPGQIRSGYLSYKFRGSIKSFMKKAVAFWEYAGGTPTGNVNIGKAEMYAFELLVDSRVTEEPDIKVGLSIKQKYSCRAWNYTRGMMAEFTEV